MRTDGWQLAVLVLAGLAASAGVASAADNDTRPAKGIQDNSFLIEEAYNQEPGVVQHINAWRRQGRDWSYTFTQEWPLGSQLHQFSYSVPYLWLREGGVSERGFGDIMLNYRYQAITETATLPAFAPRLSLILPTGDRDKGTGEDSTGLEVNLPFSKVVSDRVTLHANAGLASFLDVEGRSPTSYRLGGSGILALSRDTNVLLEAVAAWEESVAPGGDLEREFSFTLSPGIRHAFNFPGDTQLVLGAAAPITFSQGATDYGVFLYLSLEHKFLR